MYAYEGEGHSECERIKSETGAYFTIMIIIEPTNM